MQAAIIPQQGTTKQALTAFLTAFEHSMANNTIAGYNAAYAAYTKHSGHIELTWKGANAYVTNALSNGIQPQTINANIGLLSRFCDWCVSVHILSENFLSAERFPRLKVTQKLNTASRKAEGLDISALLKTAAAQKSAFRAVRDPAMIVVMGVAACRRQELADIRTSNVMRNVSGGYDILHEHTKNGHEAISIVPSKYGEYITVWIDYCRAQGIISEWLFVSEQRGHQKLALSSINKIMSRYGVSAVHTLRHKAAITAVEAGATIDEVARHLHNSPAVVARYYQGKQIDKQREAAERYY